MFPTRTSRLATFVLFIVPIFMLSACGGGKDNDLSGAMPDRVVEQPETTPEPMPLPAPDPERESDPDPDTQPDPMAEPGANLPEPSLPEYPDISTLPAPRKPDRVTYYRGDRDTVVTYLQDVIDPQHGPGVVTRFSGMPKLLVGERASAEDIEHIQSVVDDLNPILPAANQIRFDTASRIGIGDILGAGEIVILMEPCPAGQLCIAGVTDYRDGLASPGEAAATYGATITINDAVREHDFLCSNGNEGCQLRGVVLHELLHALGLRGHVRDSLVSAINDAETGIETPTPADRDGLTALYSLGEGDSATDLGPWEVTNQRLQGTFDEVPGIHLTPLVFGVQVKNGQMEAYVKGPTSPPLTGSGSATWGGSLLGMTPEHETVSGDAHLQVNLDDMTGRADFTALETWDSKPGSPGTGATWGTGRLGYTISATGSTFAQTGGDAGELRGAFYGGESHPAMGGTLERDDLTAAFGGISTFWNEALSE